MHPRPPKSSARRSLHRRVGLQLIEITVDDIAVVGEIIERLTNDPARQFDCEPAHTLVERGGCQGPVGFKLNVRRCDKGITLTSALFAGGRNDLGALFLCFLPDMSEFPVGFGELFFVLLMNTPSFDPSGFGSLGIALDGILALFQRLADTRKDNLRKNAED